MLVQDNKGILKKELKKVSPREWGGMNKLVTATGVLDCPDRGKERKNWLVSSS